MAVDLSRSIRPLLEGAMDRASRCEQSGRWREAAEAWDEAARLARQFATNAASASEKQRRLKTAEQFTQNAVRARQPRTQPSQTTPPERPHSAVPTGSEEVSEHQAAVQALLHRSTVGWDDIAGLGETKRAIQSAYALSLATAPAGVQLSPVRNILFYGPPGCGKSLLAAATSRGLEASFFNVKVSNLLSKYFGESSRLVSALYAEARQQSPSVVFLDEVDAPLDDANVDRFVRVVKKFSAQSQFIVVTHNKRTMEAGDVLHGVTMEEPGVSKLVSVKMGVDHGSPAEVSLLTEDVLADD